MAADTPFTDAGIAADAVHDACQGGPGWFVGTASSPRDRLERFHNVRLDQGSYAFLRCTDAGVALAAARLLREEHGYVGGCPCPGSDRVFVYAYAITADTR